MNTYEVLTTDGYRTIKADYYEIEENGGIRFWNNAGDSEAPYRFDTYFAPHYVKMVRIKTNAKQKD